MKWPISSIWYVMLCPTLHFVDVSGSCLKLRLHRSPNCFSYLGGLTAWVNDNLEQHLIEWELFFKVWSICDSLWDTQTQYNPNQTIHSKAKSKHWKSIAQTLYNVNKGTIRLPRNNWSDSCSFFDMFNVSLFGTWQSTIRLKEHYNNNGIISHISTDAIPAEDLIHHRRSSLFVVFTPYLTRRLLSKNH